MTHVLRRLTFAAAICCAFALAGSSQAGAQGDQLSECDLHAGDTIDLNALHPALVLGRPVAGETSVTVDLAEQGCALGRQGRAALLELTLGTQAAYAERIYIGASATANDSYLRVYSAPRGGADAQLIAFDDDSGWGYDALVALRKAGNPDRFVNEGRSNVGPDVAPEGVLGRRLVIEVRTFGQQLTYGPVTVTVDVDRGAPWGSDLAPIYVAQLARQLDVDSAPNGIVPWDFTSGALASPSVPQPGQRATHHWLNLAVEARFGGQPLDATPGTGFAFNSYQGGVLSRTMTVGHPTSGFDPREWPQLEPPAPAANAASPADGYAGTVVAGSVSFARLFAGGDVAGANFDATAAARTGDTPYRFSIVPVLRKEQSTDVMCAADQGQPNGHVAGTTPATVTLNVELQNTVRRLEMCRPSPGRYLPPPGTTFTDDGQWFGMPSPNGQDYGLPTASIVNEYLWMVFAFDGDGDFALWPLALRFTALDAPVGFSGAPPSVRLGDPADVGFTVGLAERDVRSLDRSADRRPVLRVDVDWRALHRTHPVTRRFTPDAATYYSVLVWPYPDLGALDAQLVEAGVPDSAAGHPGPGRADSPPSQRGEVSTAVRSTTLANTPLGFLARTDYWSNRSGPGVIGGAANSAWVPGQGRAADDLFEWGESYLVTVFARQHRQVVGGLPIGPVTYPNYGVLSGTALGDGPTTELSAVGPTYRFVVRAPERPPDVAAG